MHIDFIRMLEKIKTKFSKPATFLTKHSPNMSNIRSLQKKTIPRATMGLTWRTKIQMQVMIAPNPHTAYILYRCRSFSVFVLRETTFISDRQQ